MFLLQPHHFVPHTHTSFWLCLMQICHVFPFHVTVLVIPGFFFACPFLSPQKSLVFFFFFCTRRVSFAIAIVPFLFFARANRFFFFVQAGDLSPPTRLLFFSCLFFPPRCVRVFRAPCKLADLEICLCVFRAFRSGELPPLISP